MSETVREQTAAIAAGDTDAFSRFFRARFAEMYAEVRRATNRDESFCLDVVQDAMMRIIRSMKPMDTEERLRVWCRVVVQSCAYDRLRKESRRRRWEEASASRDAVLLDDQGAAERLAWLRRQLEETTDPHNRLLVLRYRFGWSLQRIAEAVGLRTGAVDGRLRRRTNELRRRAQEAFDE